MLSDTTRAVVLEALEGQRLAVKVMYGDLPMSTTDIAAIDAAIAEINALSQQAVKGRWMPVGNGSAPHNGPIAVCTWVEEKEDTE